MLNNKNASMNRHVYVYFNVEKQNNHQHIKKNK